MTGTSLLDLRRHPSTQAAAVRGIQVSAMRTGNGELRLTYRLDGEIDHIRIAPESLARVGHELWRHTCFEAFIREEGQGPYHEFNLAPSREWTVYALAGYRDGAPLTDETMDPHIAVRRTDNRLELDATIRLAQLSRVYTAASLQIGLAAVIEVTEGLSYWALRHPSPKPDFHHVDSFALLLPSPGVEG